MNYFKKNHYDSGNEKIDNIIQEMQLIVDYYSDIIFEWIPYDQLNCIEVIVQDDLHTIYSAIWKDGPLYCYDKKWMRRSNKEVSLKYLYNSQNITKFLDKVKSDFKAFNDIIEYNNLSIYGISQNPDTQDYIMIFPNEYCKRCGEQYKDKNHAKYEWCKPCQINNLKNNLIKWNSENEKINNLIQDKLLEMSFYEKIIIEWIPYNQFNNIEGIVSEGDLEEDLEEDLEGLDKEYSAIWKNGPLNYNKEKNEYTRNQPDIKVILKLCKSINESFDKVKAELSKYHGKIFGISQNLDTKDFILVFQEGYDDEKCEKCGKKYTSIVDNWCKPCHKIFLKKLFTNWTSGNDNIDNFIEKHQHLLIKLKDFLFEYIPYNQFDDIKEVGIDNYAMAIWKDGPLHCYNKKWSRESNKNVYLKLYDSENADAFLDQIRMHLIKCDYYNPSYGISKNPYTKHYIMVFQRILYCKNCGRKYNEELKSGYDNEWCKECEINNLKLNFGNWTSGNDEIDYFIQKMQLKINLPEDIIIEWIPFNQFIDVKLIVEEDDFTRIYSVIWKNDLLYYDLLYYNSLIIINM
ncbi:hypothetical protein RhiirC2_473873 [Rhizophagus irregularis]|uniref:Uncharacterized protein n=1 Tax=Rhizophagus irregularis TaxID=588596 RepID=A0A2N1N8L7_9GLOM|nr:hypothetical protein RhiirC2_473873 [Rhizophagus irregularis]